MPWTNTRYPNAFKNLTDEVRNKAIEIGNALLEEKDMEEGIVIATAISRAKDWAANRDLQFENPKESDIVDVKAHDEDRYVIPYENEWAIKVEGEEHVEKVFHTKKEAVSQARKEARKANASLTIQEMTGKVEKKISYNPRKVAPKR